MNLIYKNPQQSYLSLDVGIKIITYITSTFSNHIKLKKKKIISQRKRNETTYYLLRKLLLFINIIFPISQLNWIFNNCSND